MISHLCMTCHFVHIDFVFISTGTFDVQNIEHFEDPLGSICVLCIFANRSNAKGCHIKLEETMENSNSYRNTSRPACFRVTEGGNYTLLAYDIEENETDAPTDFSARRPAINRTIVATGPGMLSFLSQISLLLCNSLLLLVSCKSRHSSSVGSCLENSSVMYDVSINCRLLMILCISPIGLHHSYMELGELINFYYVASSVPYGMNCGEAFYYTGLKSS